MNLLRIIVLVLLLSLTIISTAAQRLQAIHNAADPQLALIDIWITVFPIYQDKIENVPFRAATSFIDVPFPNLTIDVGIAPSNSTSINDTLKNFTVTVPSGVTYIGTIQGVLNTSQFAPNPDGLDISLNAVINQNGRETSHNPGEVDIFFVHGVTDAPTLDLYFDGGAIYLNNVPYSGFTNYISLPAVPTVIQITDSGGANNLFDFSADLSSFSDSAITVFASGFVDPSANQNGEPFGLFAATPGGNVIQFSALTDVAEPLANATDGYQLHQNYPNPFNPVTNFEFRISDFGFVSLKVYDVEGREVAVLVNERMPAGEHQVQWDARGFASGVYLYKLSTGEFVQSRKMLLLR